MPNRHYWIAIACYLTIPALMIGGMSLSRLIDPEWARTTSDYARNFRLLQLAATGAIMTVAGLICALWLATCYFVLMSRQRSALWLPLAAGGPFGFMFIAMLADHSPARDEPYQQLIRGLKPYWRVLFEIAVFVSVWVLAYQCVEIKRELSIAYEAFATGVPVEAIVAQQNASSGMYAFGESLEAMYVVTLLYLLWPIFFNLVGRRFKRMAE